jgi:hypothetical protein
MGGRQTAPARIVHCDGVEEPLLGELPPLPDEPVAEPLLPVLDESD